MRKTQIPIGTRFGKLTVIECAESDKHGNQYVLVSCSCVDHTVKRMRATALTLLPYEDRNGKARLPHRSCGCESRRAYREYWQKRASGIRKLVRRNVWRAYQNTPDAGVVANEFKLPKPLIFAMVRIYNWKQLRSKHGHSRGSAIPQGSKAREEWDRKQEARTAESL